MVAVSDCRWVGRRVEWMDGAKGGHSADSTDQTLVDWLGSVAVIVSAEWRVGVLVEKLVGT